jgi:hypothetical protein
MSNTVVYWPMKIITVVKGFIVQTPGHKVGVNSLKHLIPIHLILRTNKLERFIQKFYFLFFLTFAGKTKTPFEVELLIPPG